MIEGYFNRYDPNKGYDKHLFRAGKGLQSAELNEIQDQALGRIQGIADAVFNDGDVIDGADCIINAETGETTLAKGKLYLRGAVRHIAAAQLQIPTTGTVQIGVWLLEKVVTELEDPSLLDPAPGTRNYQEPGAARLQTLLEWGLETDDKPGDFYPVYTVINGVLIQHAPPPQLDAVTTALARYDRESNGSFIVQGLSTVFVESLNDGSQVFSLSEGKAHVNGFEVQLEASIRLIYAQDADLQEIVSEPHRFNADANGTMVIALNHTPIAQIANIDITAEKTVTMTHGSYSGAKDTLPDATVLEIIKITQGSTTYQQGTDFKLTADTVDWSLSGSEPAGGSTYEVTYQYRTTIQPLEQSATEVIIEGAVEDSLVLIDYTYKLPRIDRLTLDADGVVRRIKGLSSRYTPQPPAIPAGQMPLCQIVHDWLRDPQVINDGIKVIPMHALENMQQMIADLYDLMAIERLKNDATAQSPAAQRGVFVDPFFDDDMRDQGVEQTAAIVGGELVLPIEVEVVDLLETAKVSLPHYELEPIIEQTAKTGEMKINPYAAFDPMPARCELILDVDHFVETRTQWLSPMTRTMVQGWGFQTRVVGSSTRTEVLNRTTQTQQFLRPKTVRFKLQGFGAGERLDSLEFDGIQITPQEVSA